MPQTKLYLPYGTLRGEPGGRLDPRRGLSQSPLTLHWFYVGRREPAAPYASLILGYRHLTDVARERVERIVDEFFTEAEFHLLRDYLRSRYGDDVRTAVLVAPISATKPDTSTRAGALRPFAGCVEDPTLGSGFCKLSEEDSYTLPFAVWGYYAAATAPPAFDLTLAAE